MNAVLQVIFGLIILGLPVLIAGSMVVALLVSASLVPLLMPISCLLVLGFIGISWLQWRRARKEGRAV